MQVFGVFYYFLGSDWWGINEQGGIVEPIKEGGVVKHLGRQTLTTCH